MLKKIFYCIFILLPALAIAQRTQTIMGHIADKETKIALAGVVVSMNDKDETRGSVTDNNGNFHIDNIPVGKRSFTVSYMGYSSQTFNDIDVTSAKEVILDVEMEEEAVKMNEVVVTQKRDHINDMALVSTKTFDVEETDRYAGSRSDPARMASNFAGVQGGDDSRNDIIIRGNSPQGVLWRLEGIDIPNPNHFAIPGTTGGPVSMLNNKTLANSDFFTGAFPAEYGDAVAGVFDLRLRNGNSDRYEFTAQAGLLGTEVAGEGPISRADGSSFLFAYRYSTLALFQGLHINIGTTSIPNYQDLTLKLNFPIGKKSDIAVFGIGGLSSINLIVSNQTQPTTQLYGESDADQYFTSNTGILGASYNYIINKKTFLKLTVAETGSGVYAHQNYIFRDTATYAVDSLKPILGYTFKTTIAVAHLALTHKISPKQTLKLGIINNYYQLNLIDSSRQYPVSLQQWQQREDFIGTTDLAQAYIEYKYKPTDNITLSAGVHGQYLSHNGSSAVEPRFGFRWAITNKDAITVGYGIHSEMQPLYQYFAHEPTTPASDMQNYNIGFTRSEQFVIGYDKALTPKLHLKLETYYQYLYDVPVETTPGSSYSEIDQGTGYSRYFPDTLKNTGTGYNYGIELTLQKSFSHGFYFLLTGSLYNSEAKGNDGVYRPSDYDTKHALNFLAGYEKKLGANSVLITGVKVTWIGGMLYSPVDTAKSLAYGDAVVVDSLRNTLHFKDYFRTDVKLGARFNAKRMTHEIGIDLVNIFNTQNILSLTYSQGLAAATAGKEPFYYQYQLGFLPIFYYKIDFGFRRKEG